MRQTITASRLRTHRRCARLHHLMYGLGYRPVHRAAPLALGTVIHLGIEAWWRGEGAMADIIGRVLKSDDGRELDAYEAAKVRPLLLGYAYRAWPDRRDWEVVAVEEVFRAPLYSPDLEPSPDFDLAGRIDLVLRRDGRNYIVDHKTTSADLSEPTPRLIERLAFDEQMTIYWLGAESGMRIPVSGIIYDCIGKPGIRPLLATPPENRRYRKDGELYANQRETDETPEEYSDRIAEEIERNPERYYRRHETLRLDHELHEGVADIWQDAAIIAENIRARRHPRNPNACHDFNRTCEFWDVCAHGADPEFSSQFTRSDNRHPELVD